MKLKSIILFFTLIALSLSAQPQGPGPGGPGGPGGPMEFNADSMLVRLTNQLSLTEEQQAKIKPVLVETKAKLDALEDEDYDDMREKMDAHRTIMEENDELIKEFLTEDQITKLDEMKSQRPEPPSGGGGPGN